MAILLTISSSAIKSLVLLDGIGKAYRTIDSPVGGDLRTIGSVLSCSGLVLRFSFSLGDELSSPFLKGNSGTLVNFLLVVDRCFARFIFVTDLASKLYAKNSVPPCEQNIKRFKEKPHTIHLINQEN